MPSLRPGRTKAPKGAAAAAILTLILISFLATTASAKSTIWNDVALLNSNWSDALNWSNGVPIDGDTVYFAAIGGTSVLDITNLYLGKLDMSGYAGTLTMTPFFVGVGTDVIVDGTFECDGMSVGGNVEVYGTLDNWGSLLIQGNLFVDGTLINAYSDVIEIGGDFVGSSTGSVDVDDGQMKIAGDADFSGLTALTFGSSNGELVLESSGAQQLTVGAGSNTFNIITVEHSHAADKTTFSSTGSGIVVDNQLYINEGIVELNTPLTVKWSTEIYTGGALQVTGPPLDLVLLGGVFMYGGRLSVMTPGSTLKFPDKLLAPVHVSSSGTLEIVSATTVPIALAQDGTPGGTRWDLYVDTGASVMIAGVVVEDADATGPAAVLAFNGVDGGNNLNWNFGGSMWTGEAILPIWSDPTNWGGVPVATGNLVTFWHTAGISLMDIPGLTIAALDLTRFAGTLTLDGALGILNDAEIAPGSALHTGGNSMNVGGDLTVNGELANTAGSLWVGNDVTVGTGNMELLGGYTQFSGLVDVDTTARLAVGSGSTLEFEFLVTIEGLFEVSGESTLVEIEPVPTGIQVRPTGSFIVDGSWPPSINLYSPTPQIGTQWWLTQLPGATVSVEGARIRDGFASPDVTAINSADDGNNTGWHFTIVGAEDEPAIPRTLAAWNAPNPFNPTTTVFIELPSAGEVMVAVYDVRGRLVRTLLQEPRPAGRHPVVWDGRDDQGHEVASGIYLYDVVHGGRREGGKMALLK